MKKNCRQWSSYLLFCLLCLQPVYSNGVSGLLPEDFELIVKRFKNKTRDPFALCFERQKNYLIDEEESDLTLFSRITRGEILSFLRWWETKYQLTAQDLEAIYGGQHVLEQKYPGRYWKKLDLETARQLRLSWWGQSNGLLLPEYKVYIRYRAIQQINGRWKPYR
jgi:hypothetical protein